MYDIIKTADCMSVIWLVLLAIAGFWAVFYNLNRAYDLKRRGITLESGMLMWRTRRGLKLIDRIAKASLSGWRKYGTAAAVIGVILTAFVFGGFVLNAILILKYPGVAPPGARFVIPGLWGIPLWEGLLAIFSVLIVHEFSHGVVLRAQGLPTKSVGVLLFIALPGAFVEPDEKKLKASSVPKRLRVYGAGSFANILFALVCLGLILLAVTPKPGVYVLRVAENGPSSGVLWEGARIVQIDNTLIESWGDYFDLMENVKPGDNLRVVVDNKVLTIMAGRHAENVGDLGIATISAISPSYFLNPFLLMSALFLELRGYPFFHPYAYDLMLPWPFINALKWIFMLNFGIGLFNLLPAIPLDGGYIVSGLVEWKSSPKVARRFSHVLSLLVLAVLIINIAPTLW